VKRILIVDDDKVVVESAKRVLEEEGFQVETALSGEDAVNMVGRIAFDLLLIDLMMPGQDGISVSQETSRLRPETQVILMSGYATAESAAEGLKAGAKAFIAKPFTPDELLDSVKRVLGESSSREEPEEN